MKKILIIGLPGAGKSTFAKKLSEITKIPLYHIDLIYHKEDKTTVSRFEFNFRVSEILNEFSWIIDGHYLSTLEKRLAKCDTVFFFDLPTDICLEGAKARVGKKRDDFPWIETELDYKFLEWIKNFRQDQIPETKHLLNLYNKKINVITFKSRNEADEYLKMLKL